MIPRSPKLDGTSIGPWKGMNRLGDISKMGPEWLWTAKNWYFADGIWTERPGAKALNSLPVSVFDNMEYSGDVAAQAAWGSSSPSDLQCYSESSVIKQGTYSLRMVAGGAGAGSHYFTRTFAAANWTGFASLRFWTRATITGALYNITVTSGADQTVAGVTIIAANTWEQKTITLTAARSAVVTVRITMYAPCAASTMYIDNMELASSGSAITSIYELQWDSGARELICQMGTRWYSGGTDMATLTPLQITGSTDFVATNVPFTVTMCYISGTKYALITNGSEVIQKYNGTICAALGGSPPKAKYIHVFNNRIVLWGLTETGLQSTARGSGLDAAEDWTTAGVSGTWTINLASVMRESDTPSYVGSYGDTSLVFGFLSHYVIYSVPQDATAAYILDQNEGDGMLSPYATSVNGEVYFASKTGIKNLSTSLSGEKIDLGDVSAVMNPFYTAQILSSLPTCPLISLAIDYKRHLFFAAIPYGSAHVVMVKSLATSDTGEGWSYFTGIPCNSMCVTAGGRVLFGGSTGIVYELFAANQNDDAGVAIPTEMTSAFLYCGSQEMSKNFAFIQPKFRYTTDSTAVTLTWYYGLGPNIGTDTATITLTGTATYPDGFYRYFREHKLTGRGASINISFTRSKSNGAVALEFYDLFFKKQGRKWKP